MLAAVPVDPWSEQRASFLRMAPLAESPAEMLLLPALLALGGPEAHFFGPAGFWTLEAQVSVPTEGRTYRIDFATTRGEHKVAIEVDGWSHHHATEAQEAYDACRDLALKARRWAVVRVAAARVFENPIAAAGWVSSRLVDLENGSWNPFWVPLAERSDEEFAKVVGRLDAAAQAAEAAGNKTAAKTIRSQANRARLSRDKEDIRQQIAEAEAVGDHALATELLRQVFERRRAELERDG